MIHIKSSLRSVARGLIVGAIGKFSTVSPGVHILAGHQMGRGIIKDKDVFLHMLKVLSKQARFIRIEEACSLIDKKIVVDEPLISFTFDDGFSECFSHIAPTLEFFGTNAAFFINPAFIHGDVSYISKFTRSVVNNPGKTPMRHGEVRELAQRGFVVGAHTVDHVDLQTADEAFLRHQIVDCKALVEEISGEHCGWFAWTFGGYKHISNVALEIALGCYERVFSSDDYARYASTCGRILNRRHFEPDWSPSDVKFFLRHKREYS